MALRHKSSVTPAAEPNLMPGQIGVNLPDDALFYRGQGKVQKIALGRWRTRAAPAEGAQDGAPLMIGEDGPFWSTEYAPSSRVGGHVRVDPPPASDSFSLPGVSFDAPASDLVLAPNDLICEPFYVASDQINVSRIAYNVIDKPAGMLRMAIVDKDRNVLAQTSSTALTLGIRDFSMNIVLLRGAYRLLMWAGGGVTLGTVRALVPNQGWDVDATTGSPAFLVRERANAPFTNTVNLTGVTLTPERAPQPGQPKALMIRWAYPAD